MTLEALRNEHQARPFRPFVLNLADGRSFLVGHPEFLAHTGGGRTIFLGFPDSERYEIIDLPLVTSLNVVDTDQSRRNGPTNGPLSR